MMKPGTYVSRSVHAKLQGEKNRLLRDIRVMACGEPIEAIKMRVKWREKFARDRAFDEAIKKAAHVYMDEHPEVRELIKGLRKK